MALEERVELLERENMGLRNMISALFMYTQLYHL